MRLLSQSLVLIFLLVLPACGDAPLDEGETSGDTAGTTEGGSDAGTSDGSTDNGGTDDGTTTGTPVCDPGNKYCQGDVLFICNIQGSGYNQTNCPFGCAEQVDSAGCNQGCQQKPPACKDQIKLEICNDDGTLSVTDCDYACQDGACIDPPQLCVSGAVFCDPSGKTLLTCADDGTEVADSQDCQFGCGGDTAGCLDAACQEGETQCSADNADLIELCKEDQTGWLPVNEACEDGCEDGKCIVLACEPSAQICGPLGIMECSADGQELTLKKPCKTECVETEDGVSCAKCLEGTKQCNGNTVEICVDKMVGFEISEACNDLQACANNECIDVLVLTDANGKTKNYMLITKAFVSCFNKAVEGVCRPIDTVDLSSPVKGGDLIDWFCDEKKVTPSMFDSQAQYDTAKDIMGCSSLFSPNVDDFQITGGKIVPGQDSEQCIGYTKGFDFWDPADINGKEVVVDLCETFWKS